MLYAVLFAAGQAWSREPLPNGQVPFDQAPLADAVAAWALAEAGHRVDSPGNQLFDDEWTLGACQMAVLGLGQVVLAHPEAAERYLPAMDACAGWLVTPEARAFGTRAWGRDGIADPEPTHAYLGYLGLALGMRRLVSGDAPWAEVHDQLTEALAARLAAPVHELATYPGQTYPPDIAMVAGAVCLADRATGSNHTAVLADWERRFRAEAVDPDTGWLIQRLWPDGSGPADEPRGSGTALAIYALSFCDGTLSADLYRALVSTGYEEVLGMGGIREYPPGVTGDGDIDSGPIVMGLGVSATGFSIAGATIHQDAERRAHLVRTAAVFGVPTPSHGGRWYATGGAIGNTILLAMLTALPPMILPPTTPTALAPSPGAE